MLKKTITPILVVSILSLSACSTSPTGSKSVQQQSEITSSPIVHSKVSEPKSLTLVANAEAQPKKMAPAQAYEAVKTNDNIVTDTPFKMSSNENATTAVITKKTPLVELNSSNWTATSIPASNRQGDLPSNAFDGDTNTRWSTGAVQEPGQLYTLDLKKEESVGKITLETRGSPKDSPLSYVVSGSSDNKNWQTITSGIGDYELTEIIFPVEKIRYIRIEQLEQHTETLWWSIHEIKVFGQQ